MITKRIIPCLDVIGDSVVKGVNFKNLQQLDSPITLAKYYSETGADELVFYDITASVENRKVFTEILKKVAREVFIPLTVGGGISTLEDFERVLNCGADKVSVNSGAIKNPKLIAEAVRVYGSQCVILSADIKRNEKGGFSLFAEGGRKDTGIDAIEWIKRAEVMGVGELVINSIDADGMKKGFDLEMLQAISNVVKVPIIASGGAGCQEDFYTLFKRQPKVDAGLAASVFHSKQIDIRDLKRYLMERKIEIRGI